MTIEAVLFDIDGTLIDSNEQHVNAWAFAFREEGYPQELDDIRNQIGKGGDLLVPALLPDLEDAVRKRIASRQGDHFKGMYLDHVRAFEYASAIVAKVHASGRKVVLASSAKRDELDHYVELLDIGHYLEATTSIEDVEASKPEPDIFGVALEKIGVDPAHAIVVGDTPYDVEAALRAGIAAVGVTSGPFGEARLKGGGRHRRLCRCRRPSGRIRPIATHSIVEAGALRTLCLALIVEDPDAPAPRPLVHAIVWDMAPGERRIAEGGIVADGAWNGTGDIGRNSFLREGWLLPDPPPGHGEHDYVFQLFALSTAADLDASQGRRAFVDAIAGRVLGAGVLIGTYSRSEPAEMGLSASGAVQVGTCA